MSPVSHRKRKKKKSDPTAAMLRGLTVVSICVALLATAVFLAVPRGRSGNLPTDPQETTRQTVPPSPIPANPYGPEDFAYRNGYLTCTAGDAMLGVDVSAHQGQVDWSQVAQSGMEFAMIRLGYRGYTSGGIYEDEYALENLSGAKNAGLQIGAYFYSQALTPEEAAEEARLCISILDGRGLDLPLVYDWEYVSQEARTGNMDRDTLMACVEAFCSTVEEAGYDAMVYFNPALAESLLDLEELLEYPWWLAMYSENMTFPHAVQMWQYTASGTVPGIPGNTDINLWFR